MYDSEDVRDFTGRLSEKKWRNALMIGSFAAAGFLLLTGRRTVGFAMAGIGVATLAAEHPEKFQQFWDRAPEYLERGSRLVQGVGSFIENLAEQNARLHSVRNRGGEREYLS
jgi:hypothetical protein